MENNAKKRAQELLSKMTVEEKLHQLSSAMIFDVNAPDYEEKRDHLCGNYRNPGHFMHHGQEKRATPEEVANKINRDVKLSIEAQPNNIPPIEHGEALHCPLWGMTTSFPQPINMASTFNDELVYEIADAIGKECRAVGVRQALSPVVNIARDVRWGRSVETFGEDVLVSSNMGVAMCKGLEENGVVATPKHYVDNYSYGGRDSNASDTSERALREVYLKPFEKCFKEGGAQSVMASYNSWDGVPVSSSKKLLTDILRDEWGFDGFVVSDYGGVEGVHGSHHVVDTRLKATGASLKAGLDANIPGNTYETMKNAYDAGIINDEDIDKSVLRILTVKYRIGLFDEPYADASKANETVRCDKHKKIALDSARESIILLKNENILPFKKDNLKKIAVFGASANEFPVGKNYSGAFGVEWTADDAKTPFQYLTEYLEGFAEVVFAPDSMIDTLAAECDAAIYFTTVVEGEGMDRCDLRLPSYTEKVQADENAIIVNKIGVSVKTNQEESVKRMIAANKNSVVVLLNGSPIVMTDWINDCNAVLEAWYPGEQGSQAICEILFGEYSPNAKLPITIPKSVGQVPLFYAYKPSGRGYGYNENDGKPLYPFGYGLSYTSFELSDFAHKVNDDNSVTVKLNIKNTGNYDGAEVVQLYLSGTNCEVVRPLKELKAYKKINVKKGETVSSEIVIPEEAFFFYGIDLAFDIHDGDYAVLIGTSSDNIISSFNLKVRDKKVLDIE